MSRYQYKEKLSSTDVNAQ